MDSELRFIEQTLRERYPNIKQDDYIWRELIEHQGIGIGWHDLIIELISKIEQIYHEYNTPIEEFHIDDIKEKYGMLRFDARTSIDAVYALILQYENKSKGICEYCGKSGKIRTDLNWILCLCDACYETEKETQKK